MQSHQAGHYPQGAGSFWNYHRDYRSLGIDLPRISGKTSGSYAPLLENCLQGC